MEYLEKHLKKKLEELDIFKKRKGVAEGLLGEINHRIKLREAQIEQIKRTLS